MLLLLQVICATQQAFCQKKMSLWYDEPAQYFEESLVLGNGKHGATVFGGVSSDKIYLNDATLWSGEPVAANMNPDAYKNIATIRAALAREDYQQAEELNRNVQGKFSQSYAPLGTMYLDFKHQAAYKNYKRELDISKAVATVDYEVDGVAYHREYFVSNPDQVMVVRLSSSKKGALNFELRFESLLTYATSKGKDMLRIEGYAPYHTEPSYRGNMPNAILFDEKRGMRFSTLASVKNKGGKVIISDSTIQVTKADEAIVYVSMATSFNGFDKNPVTDGADHKAIANKQLVSSIAKGYEKNYADHVNDYHFLFDRVNLDLNDNTTATLPTDERLRKYNEGVVDRNLEILYFQYGRYLLISSSRTLGVPANLQGIWNPYIRPPWSSNYTMNINVEENYWLAECANLSEMHKPFLTFIGNLSQTGKVTAKTFYGVHNGWAACHNSDIWAMTNPVGDFGKGEPVWACWNMGGAWAVTHLWDHYLYTREKKFLSDYAYPLMKGAAAFCLEWLITDKNGYLVTSPSTSPENKYLTPNGFKGATLYGATSDLAMIRECFMQTIKASEILEIDDSFRAQLKTALEKLYPYQIGGKGHLQEWYHDWEDPEPQHRHQSHLFGLYPGHHITPLKTKQLALACRKTLDIRGDETTGWSKGWRINLWARLHDGDRAYKLFRELLRYVEPDGLKVNYGGGGGTYPNLFDAHPPFQIDGNFGGAAGVIEMLMQSNDDKIHLLPALPGAWKDGTISGICARGGFEVSLRWKEGKLVDVKILSKAGEKCSLYYNGNVTTFSTKKEQSYHFDGALTRLDN
ncbi:glycoside hydrolase family 95 protein [Pseudochryseolinea flava]|uniref:Glycoside hydrolase family 95 protein n=2 Tax=Pseudochryseolinea flava TaxID=2059302 RepID=A0A364XX19_9BACT|nr:glycoside hydrolase family 95 protein [Pseudochryseolinea flava]